MRKIVIIVILCASGVILSCKKERHNQSTAFSDVYTITNKKDIGQAD